MVGYLAPSGVTLPNICRYLSRQSSPGALPLESAISLMRMRDGGRRAQVRVCGRLAWQRMLREEDCAAGTVLITVWSTDVSSRTVRELVISIIEVEARRVAGTSRTRGWTSRSPSSTDCDVPYCTVGDVPYCKKGLSMAGFLFMPAGN